MKQNIDIGRTYCSERPRIIVRIHAYLLLPILALSLSCLRLDPSPLDTSQGGTALMANLAFTGALPEGGTRGEPGAGTGSGAGTSYLPLKTGQTVQYRWGDDGTHESGVTRGYTDNGNGTVTDNATGLVWQKCSRGQTNDATCSGAATTDDWTNAGTYCNGLSLASKTWRLPTRQDLESLPDYGTSAPAINTTVFPAAVYPGQYWSSTTYAPDSNYAWDILFISGNDGSVGHSTLKTSPTNYVRCVSGQPKEYSSNFTDYGDGTVKDNATGLIWQKCSRGQTNDATCSGGATFLSQDFNSNVDYCNGLGLASKTWRLPSVNELKTIVDTTKASGPAIDTTAFPASVSGVYRTSTTYAAFTFNAWQIDFTSGFVRHFGKAAGNYARCVSGL